MRRNDVLVLPRTGGFNSNSSRSVLFTNNSTTSTRTNCDDHRSTLEAKATNVMPSTAAAVPRRPMSALNSRRCNAVALSKPPAVYGRPSFSAFPQQATTHLVISKSETNVLHNMITDSRPKNNNIGNSNDSNYARKSRPSTARPSYKSNKVITGFAWAPQQHQPSHDDTMDDSDSGIIDISDDNEPSVDNNRPPSHDRQDSNNNNNLVFHHRLVQHQKQQHASKELSRNSDSPITLSIASNNPMFRSPGQSLDDFEILGEIGSGSHGTVHKVRSKNDGNIYVLKRVSIRHMTSKELEDTLSEVYLMRDIQHENIIQFYSAFVENHYLYIVMEYAEGGDLHYLYKSQKSKNKYLPESVLWRLFYQLLLALRYLHEHNIVHRDLKTLNVFLTKDKTVKIGDLGMSKILTEEFLQTHAGTPAYLSPEQIKRKPYDFKVDIWGLGCILYTMTALHPPFSGDNLLQLSQSIVKDTPKPLPDHYSHEYKELVIKMLAKNSQDRPDTASILSAFPQRFKDIFSSFPEQQQSQQQQQQLDESFSFQRLPISTPASQRTTRRSINCTGYSTHENNSRPPTSRATATTTTPRAGNSKPDSIATQPLSHSLSASYLTSNARAINVKQFIPGIDSNINNTANAKQPDTAPTSSSPRPKPSTATTRTKGTNNRRL